MPAKGAPIDLPPPERSGEEIGRHIDEILSRPEFLPPPRSLWDRIFGFISDLIGDALGTLLGGGGGTVLGWVLLIGFAAALVFVWVRFVPTLRRDPAQAASAHALTDRPRSSAEWLADAAAHMGAQRWRDALRCRYRALVAQLAERGVIDEIPGRTSGEYRVDVGAAAPAVAADFARVTELFEEAWYGDVPTGEAEHTEATGLMGRVLAGATP